MCFEKTLKRLSPQLRKITYQLNRRFSFFNEEDLYQEALLHLWVSFKDGLLINKTDSFLLQSCYFYLKNHLRKTEDRIKPISLDVPINEKNLDLDLKEILSSEEAKSSFDDVEGKMVIEQIMNNGLSEREKAVLSLCLDSLTTREIGQRLGISHVRVIKIKDKIKDKCGKFKGEF